METLRSRSQNFFDRIRFSETTTLILTAIVIGFGVQAFALVLLKRVYQTLGTDDLQQIHESDFHI